jgi:hypothetical protein
MYDNIIDKKMVINWEPYINASVLLDILKDIFNDLKAGYDSECLDKLCDNIDILLEFIEYNDWDWEWD